MSKAAFVIPKRQAARVAGSLAAVTLLLVLFAAFGWMLMGVIRESDHQPYFDLHIDQLYYTWTVSVPFFGGLLVLLTAVGWILFMVYRRKWSPLNLYAVIGYKVLCCCFFMFMVDLDFGNFL